MTAASGTRSSRRRRRAGTGGTTASTPVAGLSNDHGHSLGVMTARRTWFSLPQSQHRQLLPAGRVLPPCGRGHARRRWQRQSDHLRGQRRLALGSRPDLLPARNASLTGLLQRPRLVRRVVPHRPAPGLTRQATVSASAFSRHQRRGRGADRRPAAPARLGGETGHPPGAGRVPGWAVGSVPGRAGGSGAYRRCVVCVHVPGVGTSEEPAMLATDITGFLQRLRDAARRSVQIPERLTFNTCCI
jgi:hypothetical protein